MVWLPLRVPIIETVIETKSQELRFRKVKTHRLDTVCFGLFPRIHMV